MLPTLDVATHTYRLGGREIVGVTRVLDRVLGQTWRIKPEVLAEAGEIGELVHDATAWDVDNELDDATIDQSILGYVQGFRRFREECKPRFHATERIVYHRSYSFAGTLDHIVEINGEIGVLDKKSGAELATHEIQVAAYVEAENSGLATNRMKFAHWVLYLRDNGTYKLHRVKEPQRAFQIFLAALTCYRFIEGA